MNQLKSFLGGMGLGTALMLIVVLGVAAWRQSNPSPERPESFERLELNFQAWPVLCIRRVDGETQIKTSKDLLLPPMRARLSDADHDKLVEQWNKWREGKNR